MSSFSARLRQSREALGLTQSAMADRLGVSLRSYSRYENEDRELPMPAMREVAKMGISVSWLLSGIGQPLSESSDEAVAAIAKRLDGIEDELNRLKVPVVVQELGDGSALKEMYRQLIEIAGDMSLPADLRARADMILDLGFGNDAARTRRDLQPGGEEGDSFQRRLRSTTAAYAELLRELEWSPPPLTGMAIRDAMIVDNLSEEMARFILEALKAEWTEGGGP